MPHDGRPERFRLPVGPFRRVSSVGPPLPVAGSGKFSIEGAVGEKAARNAGLRNEQFVAALNGRGTAAQRCSGRIALIETALALPEAEGLKLLRDM